MDNYVTMLGMDSELDSILNSIQQKDTAVLCPPLFRATEKELRRYREQVTRAFR